MKTDKHINLTGKTVKDWIAALQTMPQDHEVIIAQMSGPGGDWDISSGACVQLGVETTDNYDNHRPTDPPSCGVYGREVVEIHLHG